MTVGTFADIRAGAGTTVDDSITSASLGRIRCYTTNLNYDRFYRSIFLFDTSPLPDDAIIDSATVSFAIVSMGNTLGLSDANAGVAIVDSTPASNTALATADYQQLGTTRLATDVAYNDISLTRIYWTLNAAGIAAINLTGITKLGTRLVADLDNVTPTWGSAKETIINAGTSENVLNKPTLTVNYHVDIAITVPALNGTLDIPVPTIASGANVTAPVVNGNLDIPTPAVAAGASITVPAVEGNLDVPVPGIAAGVNVTVPVLDGNLDIPAPTVAAGVVVTAPAIEGALDIPLPLLAAGINISVPAIELIGDIPVPGIAVKLLYVGSVIQIAGTVRDKFMVNGIVRDKHQLVATVRDKFNVEGKV